MARIAAVPVAPESRSHSPRTVANEGHAGFHADLKDALAKPHSEKKQESKADRGAGTPAIDAQAAKNVAPAKAHAADAAPQIVEAGEPADEAEPSPPALAQAPHGRIANDGAPAIALIRAAKPQADAGEIMSSRDDAGATTAKAAAVQASVEPVKPQRSFEQVARTSLSPAPSEAKDEASNAAAPATIAMAGNSKSTAKSGGKAPVSVREDGPRTRSVSIIAASTALDVTELAANDSAPVTAPDDAGTESAAGADASHTDDAPQAAARHELAAPGQAAPAAKPAAVSPQALLPAPQPMPGAAFALPQIQSQTAAAADLSQPVADATKIADLAAAIAVRAQTGAKSFEIRLDPAELGRVEVQLELGHGKADATVTAHRPETLALLVSDSRNLERALHDAGIDASNLSLNFALKGDGRQGDGGGASSRARTRSLPDAVVARSEATNASIASLSLGSSSNRLDIRV